MTHHPSKLLSLLYGPAVHGAWQVDPLEVSDVAAITDRGWLVSVVQLQGATTKEGVLDRLAEDLDLPGYFGRNWDALWDCLTEHQSTGSTPQLIVLRQGQQLLAAQPTIAETLAGLLDDACVARSASHQPLSVLWEGNAPSALPPLP